ncbi:YceI family protein [Congregibacter variabilis]|uniref:YceI family protein n=1 Tax=Congregibacter variabilis TaxID=3081200 RepID=A0ABZ0I052_9GAMM|nr:YceI family protein [Congregibacter sp. IMCC43200]
MKLLSKTVTTLAGALLLLTSSLGALADWELDGQRSTVQFMSVKNASVAELHHFRALTGGISDTGAAQVALDLDSVETLVPIRNQRMRELLFETVRFPAAMLRAEVPPSLTKLPVGETRDTSIEVEVDLHGTTQSYLAEVLVTRLNDGGLQVVISEPIVVKAADFGLDGGIEILREVAGLKSISTAVPVSGQLVFTPPG